MSDVPTFRVNFTRPMALFPLDSVVLLPQQAIPLHIFEPRYRAMVSDALDSNGQFAMAVVDPEAPDEGDPQQPEIRPSVCVAQIAEHESLPDGRFNIVVQGICRARVIEESPLDPVGGYRTAMLEPRLDTSESGADVEALRRWVSAELSHGSLTSLSAASSVLRYLDDGAVPTSAAVELVGFALTSDPEVRYRLLDEPNISVRAGLLRRELEGLASLLGRAEAQRGVSWPKGCSWN